MKAFIFLIACGLLFASCVTQKGVDRYYDKHPEQLAVKCAEKYPVREIVKPGAPVVIRDTIPGKEIPCPDGGIVKCPPSEREIITIRDTLYKEDTARLAALEAKKNAELDSLTDSLLQEIKLHIGAELRVADLTKKYADAKRILVAENIILVILIIAFIYFKR